ncbi:hypothetical protein ABBQ32_010198 [Trebouxia sp. C0010 RCD-2024]
MMPCKPCTAQTPEVQQRRCDRGSLYTSFRPAVLHKRPSCRRVPQRTRLRQQRHVMISNAKLSSTTAVEDAVTAVEDVVDRLPDDFPLQQNVVKAVEAVEEIVAPKQLAEKRLKRKQQKAREQTVYKVSAIAASAAVIALAVGAVHYRFVWHMKQGHEFPTSEALATFCLTIGGIVGMEMWARWAHKTLWHDFIPGWKLHKSHHEPRTGPFEDNDVFAIVNAVPAMGLCLYGLLTPTMAGGLCFGAGLGITLFGISYMFVHDGLVHRRFPVGPIAEVPYLKRVAIAHQLHHSEKYNGVPWGLFLGPQELEAVGGKAELDRLCDKQ